MSTQANLGDFGPDLSGLSEAEREVYQLVEHDGLDRDDVADQTARSYSAVTTLLHRARRKRGEAPQI